jgi:UDP:flavonoid glycosyltransferase YjiC (YdhE family)
MCDLAGEITGICSKKTRIGELLNTQELNNLKLAAEILRTTRESQLKAKILKNHQEEVQPQPLKEVSSKDLMDFMKKVQTK